MKTLNVSTLRPRSLLLAAGLIAGPAFTALAAPQPFYSPTPPIFGGPGISLNPKVDFESSGMRQARGENAPKPEFSVAPASFVASYTTPPKMTLPRALAASTGEYSDVPVAPLAPIGVAMATGHVASSAISADGTTQLIEAKGVEAREEVAADLNSRLDTSTHALELIRTKSGERISSRSDLGQALKDADAREHELRRSIRAAERASAENWPTRREELTTNLNAYGRAVERVEMIGSAGPVTEVK